MHFTAYSVSQVENEIIFYYKIIFHILVGCIERQRQSRVSLMQLYLHRLYDFITFNEFLFNIHIFQRAIFSLSSFIPFHSISNHVYGTLFQPGPSCLHEFDAHHLSRATFSSHSFCIATVRFLIYYSNDFFTWPDGYKIVGLFVQRTEISIILRALEPDAPDNHRLNANQCNQVDCDKCVFFVFAPFRFLCSAEYLKVVKTAL